MAKPARKTGRNGTQATEAQARPGLTPRRGRKAKAAIEARLEAQAAAAEEAAAAAALAADPPPRKRRSRQPDKSVVQPEVNAPDGEGSEGDEKI
jgi:hypothetical protein